MEKIFTDFLKKESLLGKKLLLCVSGGVDSRVLLEIAVKSMDRKNLAVFHLDHALRSNSSKDFKFVKNLCKNNNINFFGETLKTTVQKNKENYWREQRKNLSQKAAKEFGATKILTAHHATDFCETMIFRFTKGSGLSGLFPFDISTKPFWQIPKTEILKYAKEKKLSWREDPSNKNVDFNRNLIRNKVLPKLRNITQNLEKVFLHESEIFKETQAFLDLSLIEKLNFDKSFDFSYGILDLNQFDNLPNILQKEFLRKIAQKTPSFSEVKDCLKWLKNNPKGNSKKEIGGRKVYLKKNILHWN